MPRVSQIIYIFQRHVTKKQKALDSKLCTNDSKAWVSMIESIPPFLQLKHSSNHWAVPKSHSCAYYVPIWDCVLVNQ